MAFLFTNYVLMITNIFSCNIMNNNVFLFFFVF